MKYDLDNRIVKVECAGGFQPPSSSEEGEYRYDAMGRRIIRKEGSDETALIWWGNSENAEQCDWIGSILDEGLKPVARRVKHAMPCMLNQYEHGAG